MYIQVELGISLGIFEDADDENNIFGEIFYPFVIVVRRNVIKRVVFGKKKLRLALVDSASRPEGPSRKRRRPRLGGSLDRG